MTPDCKSKFHHQNVCNGRMKQSQGIRLRLRNCNGSKKTSLKKCNLIRRNTKHQHCVVLFSCGSRFEHETNNIFQYIVSKIQWPLIFCATNLDMSSLLKPVRDKLEFSSRIPTRRNIIATRRVSAFKILSKNLVCKIKYT